jgi:predicted Zn finger-like uncharacterized protein
MASELVSCPECQRKLRVPTELVGKQVKCPTCGHIFTADPATQAPPPPPPAAVEPKPTRTSKVSRDEKDDEEDEERSRRKRKRSRRDDDDDEDDDDRPRRRSRSRRGNDEDDDEDDDRPRRRRRRDFLPHRSGGVLTLGILALVLFFVPFMPGGGLVLGILAWVMGNNDLAEMRAGRMDPEGESQTNAGRVCGIIAVALHALGLVLVGAYFFCLCAGIGALGAGGRH